MDLSRAGAKAVSPKLKFEAAATTPKPAATKTNPAQQKPNPAQNKNQMIFRVRNGFLSMAYARIQDRMAPSFPAHDPESAIALNGASFPWRRK
jgi:hypothetical protein